MLSKADKKWLKETIGEVAAKAAKDAVRDLFAVEIEWEQVRDEKGNPIDGGRGQLRTEEVFLPAFIVQNIKFHEGAYRGQSETMDHLNNRVNEFMGKVDKLGQAFVTIEDPMTTIQRFTQLLATTGIMNQLEQIATLEITAPEHKQIPGGNGEGDHR